MKGEVFLILPMYAPGLLVPSPCSPAGQGSQSDSLVAPLLGPKVPFGHGCSELELVPGRQKYPAGHTSGVCAPEPRTQAQHLAQGMLQEVTGAAYSFRSTIPSRQLCSPILCGSSCCLHEQ